jgi:hypothetical protein
VTGHQGDYAAVSINAVYAYSTNQYLFLYNKSSQISCSTASVKGTETKSELSFNMIERRLKVRVDYSLKEAREQLVLRFNAALGPPNEFDLSIQNTFLKGTMRPGESQLFAYTCEYTISVVEGKSIDEFRYPTSSIKA